MVIALFLIFIVLPLAELFVIIQIGMAIGILPTLALLLLDSILGTMLMKSQGRAVWLRFNDATSAGRIPAREVADGALIILGGAFLLTPGFITDIFGFGLLLPPSRALLRKTVIGLFAKRNPIAFVGVKAAPHAERAWNDRAARRRSGPSNGVPDDYVEGTAHEVHDDEPAPERRRLEP